MSMALCHMHGHKLETCNVILTDRTTCDNFPVASMRFSVSYRVLG